MERFGLTRLILIDSYKPGTLQEIRLDGHTNLNGVNGAGKTTLLRLIPLFFGERPGRLVPKSRVTDSFAKHYLPNESSYIIFEYRREQQLCLVVIYANLNEEGLCYRFVDKGFEREDFLETRLDGSCYPVSCRNLKKHLLTRRVNCSNQLTSCSDYRTVMQNLPHGKGPELRNLIARYSFCQGVAGRRLKDIEKIVCGMLQRSTDFADLREMLVNCIDEDRDSVTLDTSMDTLEDWHKEYQAYQQCEAERGQAETLRRLAQEQEQLKRRFGELHKRLLLLQGRYQQQQEGRQAELAQTESALRDLKVAWESEERERQSTLAAQTAELETLEKQKNRLEQEKADWEARDIQHSIHLAEQQPLLAERLKAEKQGHEQMTAAVRDIDAQFARLKAEKEKNFAEQRHQLESKIQQVRADAREEEARHRAAHDEAREQQRMASHTAQDTLLEVERGLRQHFGALGAQIAQIQPDPALLDAREAKLELQQSLQQQSEEAKSALDAVNRDIKTNQSHIDKVLQQKQVRQAEKNAIEDQVAQLHRQLDSEADTLLRFLREHQPGWGHDIAKVINPELLLRDDLEPMLAQEALGLYGVTLNLEALPADLAADEQRIRERLAEHQHRLAELVLANEQADRQLLDLQKSGEQLRKQCQQAEAERGRLLNAWDNLKAELKSLQVQIEQSKRQRQQQLQDEKIAVEARLAENQRQLEALKQQLQAEERRLANQLQETLARLKQETEQYTDRIQQEIVVLEGQKQQELRQLEQQRLQSLKENAIDIEALQQLEARIVALDQQLEAARAAAETVEKYRRWQAVYWSGYAELCQRIQDLSATLQQARAQLETAKQHYQQQSGDLKTRQAALTTALEKLAQDHKTLGHIVEDSTPYARYAPDEVGFDESHTLSLLQQEFHTLTDAYKSQWRSLLGKLRHLKQTLARYPGTAPAKYYASQENELTLGGEESAWVLPILNWYDWAHQDLRAVLVNQATLFGTGIRNYQKALESFDRGIDNLSRRLARHIDSNISFDKIESIHARLTSKVQSLGYWPQIVAFTQHYDEWKRNQDGQLPDAEFADMVRQVAQQVPSKGRMEMRLVNLLELEIIVTENGRSKRATHAEELQQISSHGLSYLILCVFFIALVNMIRKDQPLNIIWPMDELKELHQKNIELLLQLLSDNHITLLSAFPDPDPDTLRLYKNRYQVVGQRELVEMEIDAAYLAEIEPMIQELADV